MLRLVLRALLRIPLLLLLLSLWRVALQLISWEGRMGVGETATVDIILRSRSNDSDDAFYVVAAGDERTSIDGVRCVNRISPAGKDLGVNTRLERVLKSILFLVVIM